MAVLKWSIPLISLEDRAGRSEGENTSVAESFLSEPLLERRFSFSFFAFSSCWVISSMISAIFSRSAAFGDLDRARAPLLFYCLAGDLWEQLSFVLFFDALLFCAARMLCIPNLIMPSIELELILWCSIEQDLPSEGASSSWTSISCILFFSLAYAKSNWATGTTDMTFWGFSLRTLEAADSFEALWSSGI